MKKIILLFAILPLIIFAQEGNNKFVIKGDIDNAENGDAYVTIFNGSDSHNDNVSIIDGKFTYEGKTDNPLMIRFSLKDKRLSKKAGRGSYPSKSTSIWTVVYPGAEVVLKGSLSDFPKVYPKDKFENNNFADFLKIYMPILNDIVNTRITIYNEQITSISDERLKELNDIIKVNSDNSFKILKKYVKNNTSSYAGLWFIGDMMMRNQLTIDEVKVLISNIDDEYKKNNFYEVLNIRTNADKYAVGKTITNFKSTLTSNNRPFCLSSLKGKYVLLDFWGTWCGPCMTGMPSIKALKDDNINKLEIIGIAKDKKEKWLAEIKKGNMNWIHILNGDGEENFVSKFNITGYPTKILIDPNGKVLYRTQGESTESYKKINELILN